MKHLNFFSKSSSRSCGHSSVTLAMTVGSPSAHRRSAMLRLLSVLVLVLTFGVGQMWGAVDPFYTLEPYSTGSDQTSTGYANAATATVDEISWKVTGNTKEIPWRIGGKGGSNSSSTSNYTRTVYSTTAIEENVTKIAITHGNSTLNALTSMTVTVSTAQNGGGTVRHTFTLNSSSTPKFEANKTINLERPNAEDWSNCYYLISYDVQAKGSSNQYLQFSQLDLYAAPAVAYTVTLKDDNSTLPEQSAGAGVTLPTRTGCTGYTFVGWTSSWTSNQTEWTQIAPTIIPSGSYSPTANVDLYPVYRKGTGTASATITTTLTEGKQYVFGAVKAAPSTTLANNTAIGAIGFTSVYSSTSWGQYTTYTPNTSGVITATINSANIWYLESISSGKYSFKNSNNASYPYIYLGTSTGQNQAGLNTSGQVYIEDVSSTCKDAFKLHPSSNGTNKLLLNTSSNYGYRMYGSNQSESASMCPYIRFYEYNVDYYYISVPNCCTSLGSINGSVSLAQLTTANPTKLKATWTMNAETGIDSYDLEIYDSNDNKVKTIKGYTSGDEITGLTPCTSYYAKLYTVSQGSPYCDGGLISTSTPVSTIGYTYGITKTNVSLKTGADEEANTCVGDFSAQYQAAAGYALPTTLTVTGASAHTWSISEGVGTLSIDADDVTGNVTTTIAGTCVPPTITVHPQGNTYAKDATADALTVTASAAGATLGYQWQTSTDNESWDDISEEDGGKAATYTPSTAAAGTTYYRVIVSNKATDCTTYKESNSAAIEVSSIPVCETPTFSPDASVAYNSNQTITISSTTEGATIYYSTDGNDPTIDAQHLYAPENKPIVTATNTTIKAIAVKAECTNSAVASATYVLKCDAPTFTPGEGAVVNGQEIALSCATAGASIYYSTDGNTPTIDAQHLYDADHKPVVSSATTIKAIAVKDNWTNSNLASADYTVKYTVSLNIGGGNGLANTTGWSNPSTGVYTQTQANTGASITLPNATLSSGLGTAGWSFAGWADAAVGTETSTAPTFKAASYIPTGDITLYAVYVLTEGGEATDEITYTSVGVTGSSYTTWSDNKTFTSDAIYGGATAGGDSNSGNAVQLRSKNSDSGIFTTASGGTAKKVTVSWNSYTTNGRTLDIYGKNTAYSALSDLYGNATDQGTKLGSIVKGTSTELTITGDYAYIGLRSNESAMYFDEIDIKWSTASYTYFSNPSNSVTLTYDGNGQTSEASTVPAAADYSVGDEATVVEPEGLAKTGYTFAGWNTKDDGTGTNYVNGTAQQSFTINTNTTLYAKWTKNSYTVTVTAPGNGNSITAPENTSIEYGTKVTLTGSAATHWSLTSWSVVDANEVAVSLDEEGGVYSFSMPASNVTVSANFTENAKRTVKFYSNGTQVGSDQDVYVGEAPTSVPTAVYESCLEGSNLFYGWATEEWTGAIASTAGKMVYTGALPDVAAGEGDVAYYAVWAKGTSTPTTSYAKITSAEDLTTDDYVIAYSYSTTQIAMGNTNKNETQVSASNVSLSDNKYSNPGVAYIWHIEKKANGSCTFYNANAEKYLNATTTPSLQLGDDAMEFAVSYNSGWLVQFNNNGNRVHGFINTTGPVYDFRASTSTYKVLLYKNEKEIVYSDFRTNCCSLKPVTNVQVGTIGETSVELTWTAPTSKTGINKYQIVDAEHEIAQDVTDVDATSATVTGLTECTTYNFKVVSVGDDCSSNSNEVEATPFAGAKVVTFDYNGGSGATTSASTSCGVATVNLPTPNARDGYNFKGWNDGTQTLAPSTATYTPAATMTLTAQWAQLYTVHYEFAGASGAPEDAQYEAGATVELPSEPNKGFLAPFEAWDYSEAVTMVDETHFTMPAKNLTITATYDEIIGQWILVTDESQLVANSYVIIAAADYDYAMSTTQEDDYRGRTGITKSGSTLTNPSENVQIFTLEAGTAEGSWAFKTLNGTANKYIYAASSAKNYLRSESEKSANSSFVLDLENGKATAQGSNSNNILSHNNSTPRFSCYGTIQTAIAFYQFREGIFYNINMPASAPTGGTVSANTSMEKAGETVTLTYKPSRGYTVKTLTVTGATSGSIAITPALEAGVTEYTFTMPAEAVTVAASFEEVDPVDYNLVTDAANLAVGMKFLLVGSNAAGDTYKASGAYNSDHLDAIDIDAPSENKISISTEEVEEITLEGESGAWRLISHAGALREASKNLFITGTPSNWTISISEGLATITSENSKPLLYNTSSPRFKPYDGTTDQLRAITLYALPYTTYNFTLSGCKTIKVVTGYTYTYTIKNSDEPSSTPGDNYTFLHKWTDGTNTYAVGDEVTVNATKTLQPCWKVTTPEEEAVTDIDGLPESVTEIVVNKDKNLNVNDDRTINTLTIKSTSGAMDVAGTSGQVTGDNTLTVTDNLFLEIKLCEGVDFVDANGILTSAASRKWYCISAPFDVAINGGFFWGDGTPMVLNTHFQLFEWDGDRRANGSSGWRRTGSDMQAGVAYFIGFDDERTNQNTIKLKAKSNTISNVGEITAPGHSGSADAETYGNWNGLGNPNFHHIALDKSVQAFDYNEQHYNAYATDEYNFVVGTPFFIQMAGKIGIEDLNDGKPFRAPKREGELYSYCVRIGSAEASRADNQIYVRASETASAEFDNERDMITMNGTTSNYGALLWTENYGGKRLAIEEAPLVNGTASYVLTLSAPANGTYSISVAAAQENADLYLTYEGAIIWNLSMGAYTMDLNKGITNGYGLLLQAKAPNSATGVDQLDNGDWTLENVQKVIIDEHVYILRGGQMYDVNGKMVK